MPGQAGPSVSEALIDFAGGQVEVASRYEMKPRAMKVWTSVVSPYVDRPGA